ncbi:MAG: ATP-dependent zinc metalloprotease FtsH [Deferribacteres bacterium]|nr:ATP-dependent zinc metalloprotease FtsH [Deferribacteres bacterium]
MEKRAKFSISYYLIVFATILLLDSLFFSGYSVKEISYKEFRDRLAAGKIQSVVIEDKKIYGLMKPPDSEKTTQSGDMSRERFSPEHVETPWRLKLKALKEEREKALKRQFVVTRLEDPKLLEDLQSHGVDYRGRIESDWLQNLFFNWIIPLILLVVIWGYVFRKMGGGPGVLNVGKSKARIYAEDVKNKITFKDVAGIDEAVEEVKEIVSFLKNPQKYTRLGAKLPKGVLLVGPPGTGKTLLARAVAGEAGVPFFSLSGSDFVEMFVGVGAARVRDLFNEAKAKAPCIIFIDELDAVGKSRGKGGYVAGYDERENTLNQLLTEMDGFDPKTSIVIMAATNRPEVLDQALLRPGRFDRQILVDRPDLKGRIQIFEVHTRKLVLDSDVDLHKLAAATPGFAGAEIMNVCNEAALLASRKGKDKVSMSDFQDAIERVIAGLEKKNKLINPRERRIVAYHESGHAIIGYFTPGADPVQKVSIVPRGIGALGYTLQTPLEDRYLMSRSELIGKIKGLLGGRASEEVVFGEVSTGASNDLERATKIVRNMLTVYGMSTRIPNISLVENNTGGFLGQGPFTTRRSEKIEQIIDEEALEIIRTCYEEDKEFLQRHRDKLNKMAETLLEKENMDEKDIMAILGPRPGAAEESQ